MLSFMLDGDQKPENLKFDEYSPFKMLSEIRHYRAVIVGLRISIVLYSPAGGASWLIEVTSHSPRTRMPTHPHQNTSETLTELEEIKLFGLR